LRERVILHNAILILPLNPATLDEKELALIERNMEQVDSMHINLKSEEK